MFNILESNKIDPFLQQNGAHHLSSIHLKPSYCVLKQPLMLLRYTTSVEAWDQVKAGRQNRKLHYDKPAKVLLKLKIGGCART